MNLIAFIEVRSLLVHGASVLGTPTNTQMCRCWTLLIAVELCSGCTQEVFESLRMCLGQKKKSSLRGNWKWCFFKACKAYKVWGSPHPKQPPPPNLEVFFFSFAENGCSEDMGGHMWPSQPPDLIGTQIWSSSEGLGWAQIHGFGTQGFWNPRIPNLQISQAYLYMLIVSLYIYISTFIYVCNFVYIIIPINMLLLQMAETNMRKIVAAAKVTPATSILQWLLRYTPPAQHPGPGDPLGTLFMCQLPGVT